METGIKRILLKSLLLAVLMGSGATWAQDAAERSDDRPLIEPDIRPPKVDEALIDDENFEIGLYAGLISIEDFETSWVLGTRLAYHLNEYFFLEGNYALAEAGESSFEKLGGNVQLLPGDNRDYTYYNLSIGYKILPGEAFVGSRYAFNTNFYLVAGTGSTEFADDSLLTFNVGAGYQVLLNDALAVNLTMRQHMYDSEILGEKKTSFNLEYGAGVSVFF